MGRQLTLLTPPSLKFNAEDLGSLVYIDANGTTQTLSEILASNPTSPRTLHNLSEAQRQKLVLARLSAKPNTKYLHWNHGELTATELIPLIQAKHPVGVTAQAYIERQIELLHQSSIQPQVRPTPVPCTEPPLPTGPGNAHAEYTVALMVTNEPGTQAVGEKLLSLISSDVRYIRSGLTTTNSLVGCTEVQQLATTVSTNPCTGLIIGCGHGAMSEFPSGGTCTPFVLSSLMTNSEIQAIVGGAIVHLISCNTALSLGKIIARDDRGKARAFIGYDKEILTLSTTALSVLGFLQLMNVALVNGATVQQAKTYFEQMVYYEGCRPGGDQEVYRELLDLNKEILQLFGNLSATLTPCIPGSPGVVVVEEEANPPGA